MRKYFYTDGTTNFGPFTLEELKTKRITRDTYVWYQGLDGWKTASSLPELNELFMLTPPPIQPNPAFANYQQPPKTWLVESILVTLFCCLPLGIVGIINATRVESRFYAGDYRGAHEASIEAKRWTTISFWLGIAFYSIYFFFIIIGVVSGL